MAVTFYRVTALDSGTKFVIDARDASDYDDSSEYSIDRSAVVTSEEIAQWCDDEAENANYHQICGVHMWLSGVLVREAGEDVAVKVMRAIAGQGGLHEGV